MNRSSLLRCVAPALVFAGPVIGQESAGPLVGSAVAIAVEGGANGSADATTHVHRNGFTSPLAQFPASPGAPNLQAILALHGAPNLRIDDISSGRDDIMVDSTGTTQVPPLGWGFFSFSVKDGAMGRPGSRIAAEPAPDRSAAVFTWILPGSLVPTPLVDPRVERSHSRFELGVPAGGDVDSLDVPTVLGVDQGTLLGSEPGFHVLQPGVPSIYFTVNNSTLALVPAPWWVHGFGPTPPSGATIFVTRRSATAAIWTAPIIYKTYAQLGFNQSEDIDGLALSTNDDTMIVSCVGNFRDQLLYIDCSTDFAIPIPVQKPGGGNVSGSVGTAGGDDIDAVCTLDPRIRSGLYVPDDFGASCGTPRDAFMPNQYPVGISASAFRRFENGQSNYDTWMIGWPPVTGRGPGWAVLAITLGNSTSPVFTALFAPRNQGNPVEGDPIRFTQVIPPAFRFSGLPLVFRWFAIDALGTEVSQAYPIKVFL